MSRVWVVECHIPEERIAAALESAWGGIGYWATGADREQCHEPGPGLDVWITDDEDDGKELRLTWPMVLAGVQLMIQRGHPQVGPLLSGDGQDMVTGDALVQFALFGEVRYG